jgi:deoxycytidylate deaminase
VTTKHNLKAIIYDKQGRVLSIGENNYTKSHPIMAHYAEKVGEPYKIYLHAEVSAIIRCQDLSKAHRISVIRESKSGKYLPAKPCKICMTAIQATPIKIIEHT